MCFLGVLGLVLSAALAGAQAQDKTNIGAAKAVVKVVRAKLADAERRLEVDSPIYADEVIATSRNSASQLKFLDDTILTVGPNSSVTLDRFVYDPNAANQTVVLNAGVGVLRFVSGKLKKTAYRIKTPTATIGIRGTILTMVISDTQTDVICEQGVVQVSNNEGPNIQQVTLTQNLATTVVPSQPPSPPAPPSITAQTSVAVMDTVVAVSGGGNAETNPAQAATLLEIRDETRELRDSHQCGC